jgi:hypothetical protein
MRNDKGTYVHCTAYKRKAQSCADRVVVKLFYREQRLVDVEVTVDRDVWQMFSTPLPKDPAH